MSESEQLSSNFAYHTGRMLGKYQLLRLIDRGGMAEVYKSYHPELERDLAVKILYPHFTDMPGFVERFRREAKAAAGLRHPNIVQIFDFDRTEDGLYYMVLEYIDGQSLESFLKAQAPLTLAQTLTLFRQIASATQYAHEHGLIHRDIKPANILLDKKGQIYLTDFGIAQILGMSRLTQTDTKAGTPIYMAPEQIENQPVNVAADVYSLGMLLYKMLTNRLPYENDNPTLVMVQKLTKPPVRPRRFKPDLAVEIEEILMTALAQEPENRFPDVVSMTWALEEAYGAVAELSLADTAVTKMIVPPGDLPLNRLEHYQIREKLRQSETRLSQRYLARNQMLEGWAILEVLRAVDEPAGQLFWQRMTAVSQLDQPHIAPVTFISRSEEGRWYAALAYMPGQTLAARLDGDELTLLAALHLARQIAHGLHTLHGINLVHGELGPETIFVGEEEEVWLMGLGALLGEPSVKDNIRAFGELLQQMLPEGGLGEEEPAALVARCLGAGYDSMAGVWGAVDEALAMELDRTERLGKAKSGLSWPAIAAGVVILLVLLVALLASSYTRGSGGGAARNNLAGATALPTSAGEEISQASASEEKLVTETAVAPESVVFNAASEAGAIGLGSIRYGAAREYVVIENRGQAAVALEGWRLESGGSQPDLFIFPPFLLAAGAEVRVWTGDGLDSEEDLYWREGEEIWDDEADTASLYDEAGRLVDRCGYSGGEGRAVCQ
jgi:serine/threonine protein kinase